MLDRTETLFIIPFPTIFLWTLLCVLCPFHSPSSRRTFGLLFNFLLFELPQIKRWRSFPFHRQSPGLLDSGVKLLFIGQGRPVLQGPDARALSTRKFAVLRETRYVTGARIRGLLARHDALRARQNAGKPASGRSGERHGFRARERIEVEEGAPWRDGKWSSSR